MSPSPHATPTDEPAGAPAARLGPRSGHPVARFVGAIVVVLAVLAGVRLTGAVNPWIEVETRSYGEADMQTRRPDGVWSVAAVVVRNRGALPVEIESASLLFDRHREVRAYVGPVDAPTGPTGRSDGLALPLPPGDDLVPLRDARLGSGEQREIVVVYLDPCPSANAGVLRIEVETALGQSRSLDNIHLPDPDLGPLGIGGTDLPHDEPC